MVAEEDIEALSRRGETEVDAVDVSCEESIVESYLRLPIIGRLYCFC